MGRTQRALTSLVGAIPAAFLAYLLVMVFLQSADSLTTMTQVLVGVTLLCAAFVALMPVGLLVLGGKKAGADDDGPVATKAPSKKAVDEEEVEEVEADDEIEADGDIEEIASTGSSEELDAFEESDAEIMSDSDDAITSGSSSSLDEIDAIDFDDEEEEEKPKKRKK